MEVQQARAADWEELRELRLQALGDAPDAFSSTLEQEAAFPEEVWRSYSARVDAAAVTFDRTTGCRALTELTFGFRRDGHAGHVGAAA